MKPDDAAAANPSRTASGDPLTSAQLAEDRRTASDRRTALDRRRGPGRRRTDYRRAAEEGHMNEEQLAFLVAVEEYKRLNRRPFPTLTEILDLVLYLGYRKVAPIGEFALSKARQDAGPDEADGETDE